MPIEHVDFDRATYVPGDAWKSPSFASRGVPPRILEIYEAAVVGGPTETPASYFEHRSRHRGTGQRVEVSVQYVSGGTTFEVVLERSFNGGDNWGTVKSFTNEAEESVIYSAQTMLRLRVVSSDPDTVLQLRMFQNG